MIQQFFKDCYLLLKKMDIILLTLVGILLFAGTVFIYGIGQQAGGKLEHYWMKQLIWISLGFLIMLSVALINYEYLGKYSWLLYLVGIFLLIFVLIFGTPINNAKSWISLPGATIQPSEIAKPLTLISLSWLATRPRTQINEIMHVIPIICLAIIPFFLIIQQPDFGSASIFIPITFTVLFISGCSKRALFYPLLAAVVFSPLFYITLKDYQKDRINVYLHPVIHPISTYAASNYAHNQNLPNNIIEKIDLYRNPTYFVKTEEEFLKKEIDEKTYNKKRKKYKTVRSMQLREGYHVHQSILAVGSGGLTGKGLMQGTQNTLGFLPRKVTPTDFIFSVIGEESGFLGAVSILLIYIGIILCAIRTACFSRDSFGRVMALAIATMFICHVFINVGMTIGIAPVVGIPLPFVSYGGSFVVTSLFSIGILQSIYIRRPSRDYLDDYDRNFHLAKKRE